MRSGPRRLLDSGLVDEIRIRWLEVDCDRWDVAFWRKLPNAVVSAILSGDYTRAPRWAQAALKTALQAEMQQGGGRFTVPPLLQTEQRKRWKRKLELSRESTVKELRTPSHKLKPNRRPLIRWRV